MTGQCCTPNCAGRSCGSDGCGGICGSCLGGQPRSPSGTCVPACFDQVGDACVCAAATAC